MDSVYSPLLQKSFKFINDCTRRGRARPARKHFAELCSINKPQEAEPASLGLPRGRPAPLLRTWRDWGPWGCWTSRGVQDSASPRAWCPVAKLPSDGVWVPPHTQAHTRVRLVPGD